MNTPTPRHPNLPDGHELADWLDTVMYAVALLRSGSLVLDGSRDYGTLSVLDTCLNDLVRRLGPRLDGIVDALVRAHRQAGGSYAELAELMDVPRATAQSRARQITQREPSHWEQWATGDLLDGTRQPEPMRLPTWTPEKNDPRYVAVH